MARRAPKCAKDEYFSDGAHKEALIAPSILSADFANLGRELARCRRAKARWIHIDIMDGHFVPNLTMGPSLVKSLRAAEPGLLLDAHLMIEKPMKFAEAFSEAGAEVITIHAETSANLVRDLRKLRRMGLKAGISIKPKTPVRAIIDCLSEVDLVLVMTVEPGFGGQSLIPSALNKVRELDLLRKKRGLEFRLQVDGGISPATAPLAAAAGADVLVAGSAVFNSGSAISDNLAALRSAIAQPSVKIRTIGRKPSRNAKKKT